MPVINKKFFVVVRRVESIAKIEKGQTVRYQVFNPNENYIVGRGLERVEIIKHIIIASMITLTFVFDAVRQPVVVKHFLKTACNRFVVGRINTVMMTCANKINFVAIKFGLISGDALAVSNSSQRIFGSVFHNGRAVKVCFYFGRVHEFKYFLVSVAESVKRRFNIAAFVCADSRHDFSKSFKLLTKLNPVFISADEREICQNQFHFRIALQKIQQRNFDVSFANEIICERVEVNYSAALKNFLGREANDRVNVGRINMFEFHRRKKTPH